MKKHSKFSPLAIILLCFSILFISCHKKEEQKKETVKSPVDELAVAPQVGFVATHEFPNTVCKPWKDTLANGDIMLHKEIYLTGDIQDVKSAYDVTLLADYYDNITIDFVNLVVTVYAPDGRSKRSQQYKIVFAGSKDKVISTEGGVNLKRHSCKLFPEMKFSSKGTAKVEVEINAPGGKFSFAGLKSLSAKVEKVAQ